MGRRGRRATAHKIGGKDWAEMKRPQAIPGMTRYARTVWKRVVDSHDYDQFRPGSLEQLRAYCESCSSHKKAVGEIKKDGEILRQENGVMKRNPWCLERDACAATMASLATKLSLNTNSKLQQGEAPKPKSKRGRLLYGGMNEVETPPAEAKTRLEKGLLYGGKKHI
jgi:P27 family predicted phage terminase small subunit